MELLILSLYRSGHFLFMKMGGLSSEDDAFRVGVLSSVDSALGADEVHGLPCWVVCIV